MAGKATGQDQIHAPTQRRKKSGVRPMARKVEIPATMKEAKPVVSRAKRTGWVQAGNCLVWVKETIRSIQVGQHRVLLPLAQGRAFAPFLDDANGRFPVGMRGGWNR